MSCILSHVTLQQRLTCCALVCRSWAAAAAAAPADVEITINSSKHCQQLQHWLTKHGAVVARLDASDFVWNNPGLFWLHLPVQHLKQLHSLALYSINAQLPPHIATHSSTRRTKGSSLTGPSSSNAVGSIGSAAAAAATAAAAAAAAATAAAVLPQLQELTLQKCQLTAPLFSQLLSATSLSQLLWGDVMLCVDVDRQTRQLTQVETYSTLWQRLQVLPKLSQLGLVVDRLTAADITPLSSMQRLQRLTMYMLEYSFPRSDWSSKDDSGPRELLAALQHLTQLKDLCLEGMALHRVYNQQEPPSSRYQSFSALTASTQLTALRLTEYRGQPVPQAAFGAMFPAGRVLPHLRELFLKGCHPAWYDIGMQPCVDAAQVDMVAASCPALQHVTLASVTPIPFDYRCLAKLPSGVAQLHDLPWSRPAS